MIGPFLLVPVLCHYRCCVFRNRCSYTHLCDRFERNVVLLCYFLQSMVTTGPLEGLMAKRRAEEIVLFDSPSKRRHFPAIYSVDVQLESMDPVKSGSPQSLLTVLGSRCRKRPPYFDNEEADSCERITRSDSGKHAKDVLTEPSSGSFQDSRRSCTLSRNKRAREDSVGSDIVTATDEVGPHGLI